MFKADGPEAIRCVGETEFVNGIAAMSASGRYGKTRVAAGIIGTATCASATPRRRARCTDRGWWRSLPRHPARRLLASSPAIENHRTEPPQGLFLRDTSVPASTSWPRAS